ncbi:unnamed protein product, partial [Rotaria magnacalcarata]
MANNINHDNDVTLILKAVSDQRNEIDALYGTLEQEVQHLQPNGQPIGQGQHVINSSIVDVQCGIIDDFIKTHMGDIKEEILELKQSHPIVQA